MKTSRPLQSRLLERNLPYVWLSPRSRLANLGFAELNPTYDFRSSRNLWEALQRRAFGGGYRG